MSTRTEENVGELEKNLQKKPTENLEGTSEPTWNVRGTLETLEESLGV